MTKDGWMSYKAQGLKASTRKLAVMVIVPPTGNKKYIWSDTYRLIYVKFTRCSQQLMYNSMMYSE